MRGGLKFSEDIVVKSNVFITARERGKIVERREGHNIFLDFGREWLAQLIAFESFSPEEFQNDERIKYMGFGIGGSRQIAPDFADTPPLDAYGPVGQFNQTDTDPTVLRLERPVQVTLGNWVGQVQAPAEHDTPTSTTFKRLFTLEDVSFAPYISVPLSEVGLFLSNANPAFFGNNIVAYDTFDTISKTTAFELEVVWTLRFG
jgi:hypothetical protein